MDSLWSESLLTNEDCVEEFRLARLQGDRVFWTFFILEIPICKLRVLEIKSAGVWSPMRDRDKDATRFQDTLNLTKSLDHVLG